MVDYRNTRYCPVIEDIDLKKEKLERTIKEKNPKRKNMYRYISNRSLPYKKMFVKAYNGKCVYCGVSKDIINKNDFQIDHFKNEASFESKIEAGSIENLVLACPMCNNYKSDFQINNQNELDFRPEKNGIINNYIRDEGYYIRISDEGKRKKDVVEFYDQLHLDDQIHRIDFLLMNMIGLDKKLKVYNKQSVELLNAINLLRERR